MKNIKTDGVPDIVVLLAVHNGYCFLERQIASLLVQSGISVFIQASDDASDDDSGRILSKFSLHWPDRFKFSVRSKGVGAKNNFSALVENCEGGYIAFSDQDDVWDPDKLNKELLEMHRLEALYPGKPIIVHSDLEVVDADLNTLSLSFFDSQRLPREHASMLDQFVVNNVTGCTMLINKAARDLVLPIPEEAIMHDWWIAAKVRYHGGVIGFIDQPLVKYRQHESNVVGARHIGIKYFCAYFMSPLRTFKKWWAIYRQAKAIDPDISAWAIFYRKIVLTFRRLKPQKGKEVA